MVSKPLSNLICNSVNIFINIMNPIQITEKPVSIKSICEMLRDDDKDFPLYDFNFEEKKWVVVPGTIKEEPESQLPCIMWSNATHNVSTIIRFFRQLGWEVTFTHWVGYD